MTGTVVSFVDALSQNAISISTNAKVSLAEIKGEVSVKEFEFLLTITKRHCSDDPLVFCLSILVDY